MTDLKAGDSLVVKVDPRVNGGLDEAPAVVTRVLDAEGEENDQKRVNVVAFMDSDQPVQRFTNVLVVDGKPEEGEEPETEESSTDSQGQVKPVPEKVAWSS